MILDVKSERFHSPGRKGHPMVPGMTRPVMEIERSCGAIIFREIEGETRVLLVQHKPGHWSFPKGHKEQGESDHETAIREVYEETGIRINILPGFERSSTYAPRPGVLKTVVFFLGAYQSGTLEPQLSEVRAVRWMGLDEAAGMLVFDKDLAIFREALACRG